MIKTLPITKVREELTRLVQNVYTKLDEYVITVNGSPAAVLLSLEEYESWKETLDLLSDSHFLKNLKQSEKEAQEGKLISLEKLKKELDIHV